MDQYTSEDARREWRLILNAVESGHAVGITRYGKPLAVVVPAGWYEDRERAIEAAEDALHAHYQEMDTGDRP